MYSVLCIIKQYKPSRTRQLRKFQKECVGWTVGRQSTLSKGAITERQRMTPWRHILEKNLRGHTSPYPIKVRIVESLPTLKRKKNPPRAHVRLVDGLWLEDLFQKLCHPGPPGCRWSSGPTKRLFPIQEGALRWLFSDRSISLESVDFFYSDTLLTLLRTLTLTINIWVDQVPWSDQLGFTGFTSTS